MTHVSHDLKSVLKSIYLQFGRFRWPESADPADLTKSENFMFFDFLRSFYVHFQHCKFDEYRLLGSNYNAENDHFTWNLAHFTVKFDHFTLYFWSKTHHITPAKTQRFSQKMYEWNSIFCEKRWFLALFMWWNLLQN